MNPDLRELLRDLRNHAMQAEFYAEDDACAVCRSSGRACSSTTATPTNPCRCCSRPSMFFGVFAPEEAPEESPLEDQPDEPDEQEFDL